MKADFITISFCALCAVAFTVFEKHSGAITFTFQGKEVLLAERMYPRLDQWVSKGEGTFAMSRYDTLCNVFYEEQNYVEIIRQDDKIAPHFGLALGFEFSPEYDSLPYETQRAVLQYKDFSFGGVQFSEQDTFNHTGVVNEYSEDFILTITGYQNDTIEGNFKGVLLNGAGEMTPIEEGYFKIGLFRKAVKD